ncbi:MAG: AraC family transcriptional regulator of adaptative response [Parasphingorhabdus sp.]|jgi:AraC family transcriptional regulator of adaptative response/methylated-DNA-[protein]-cysteine methyltransferase
MRNLNIANLPDNSDFLRVEKAIEYLAENQNLQPDLDSVADHVGLSSHHFQKIFTRWAGISPKKMLQYMTAIRAGELLRRRISTFDTSVEVGLSGNGRLHDLFVAIHAMSPGEYGQGGSPLTISYGTHLCPFGLCLIGTTEKGICWLSFHSEDNFSSGVSDLFSEWPMANLIEDCETTSHVVEQLFSDTTSDKTINVLVKGTNFQVRVWEALLNIPTGAVTTYGDLAKSIDCPKASRAVGSAIGKNTIGWLIPCHRVIRSSGIIGEYRWGSSRKQMMLLKENPAYQMAG